MATSLVARPYKRQENTPKSDRTTAERPRLGSFPATTCHALTRMAHIKRCTAGSILARCSGMARRSVLPTLRKAFDSYEDFVSRKPRKEGNTSRSRLNRDTNVVYLRVANQVLDLGFAGCLKFGFLVRKHPSCDLFQLPVARAARPLLFEKSCQITTPLPLQNRRTSHAT